MKDIKEVRQALDNYCLELLKYFSENNRAIIRTKNYELLDQFITDVEELIKENEELKKQVYEAKGVASAYLTNLTKVRELEKENEELKDSMAYHNLSICKEMEKKLAITEKLYDKSCEIISNVIYFKNEDNYLKKITPINRKQIIFKDKEWWKNYFMESEKEQ